ncbi:hypothetical protein BU16DRAFT_594086 [Lophium mytilinum]|uniref:Peptidase S8/S53 domain-containing protein n=1 Tax=Lophium mytilinum TaxID=390894 RepID=A0A6A6QKI6_9PEZI|nr:hypothetical protein BU16DRAFT_594086 [Lophium mytilinum]
MKPHLRYLEQPAFAPRLPNDSPAANVCHQSFCIESTRSFRNSQARSPKPSKMSRRRARSCAPERTAIVRLAEEGDQHRKSGNHSEATQSYRQAAQQFEDLYGAEAHRTLLLRDKLATSLHDAGDFKGAASCNEETLHRRQKSAPNESSETYDKWLKDVLENRRRLAVDYVKLERVSDALTQYRGVLHDAGSSHLSLGHDVFCRDRNNLAQVLSRTGVSQDAREAVDLNFNTLKTAEATLGKSHREVSKSRYSLGRELARLGKIDDATEHFRDNVVILSALSWGERDSRDLEGVFQDSKVMLQRCMRNGQETRRPRDECNEAEKQDMEPRTTSSVRHTNIPDEKPPNAISQTKEVNQKGKNRSDLELLQDAGLSKTAAENNNADGKREDQTVSTSASEINPNEVLPARQIQPVLVAKALVPSAQTQYHEASIKNIINKPPRLEGKLGQKSTEQQTSLGTGHLLPTEDSTQKPPQSQEVIRKKQLDDPNSALESNTDKLSIDKRETIPRLASPKQSPLLEIKAAPTSGDLPLLDTLQGASVGPLTHEPGDEKKPSRSDSVVSTPVPTIVEPIERSSDLGNLVDDLTPAISTPLLHLSVPDVSEPSNIPGGWKAEYEAEDDPPGIFESFKPLRQARSTANLRPSNLHLDFAGRPSRSLSVSNLRPRNQSHSRSSSISRSCVGHDRGADLADKWFQDLEKDTHPMLEKYSNFTPDADGKKTYKHVKIAILDSGVARKADKRSGENNIPSTIQLARPHIKEGKMKGVSGTLPWDEDVIGHGTHGVGLLLKVCPWADIYVYRVIESQLGSIRQDLVAAAIEDAAGKVDIISMSLGWERDDPQVGEALERAKKKGVLLFAASSNDGVNGGMSFPARADEVIAIDSANYHGEPSPFNTPEDDRKQRFTALGEDVESAFPPALQGLDDDSDGFLRVGFKRSTGSSCATPIAAATAALILEFAKQPPLCYDPRVLNHLKTLKGMRYVFNELVSQKKSQTSRFNHLNIRNLLCCDEGYLDGGDWADSSFAPRYRAARKIIDCLQRFLEPDLGAPMLDEMSRATRKMFERKSTWT